MKKIALLGSTGSIGRQTTDVIRETRCGKITALAANGNDRSLLDAQIREFSPAIVSVNIAETAEMLAKNHPNVRFLVGGCEQAAAFDGCDTVVNAVSGDAGLTPAIAALKAGKTVALANKETLVAAGRLVMRISRENDAPVLPVDSEHSAIFQCLNGAKRAEAEKIYLTASGGPFRGLTAKELQNVKPRDALKHPNWSMGAKVTIDSATMMNKGLEMIEAHILFGVAPRDIVIVVHPQSVVHSMVQFRDGAVLAQLGAPDMRVPIQYALTYPDRISNNFPRLNPFDEKYKNLSFEKPDFANFPCLQLAFDAVAAGGELPCVLSAADEIAVARFLREEIGFNDIPRIIERTMNAYILKTDKTFGDELEKIRNASRFAREYASALILN